MNIAHFASEFYPSPGGVQEFVRQIAAQQLEKGDSPLIVSNRWPKNLPSTEIYERIPVRRFVFRVPEANWRQLPGAAIFGVPTLLRILHLLRQHQTDIIHIQCVSSNAFYALHASRTLNLPLVATLHGELTVDNSGLFQRSRFAQKLLRKVLDTADAITACSTSALGEAESFYGKSLADRGQVIHNGVLADEFQGVEPHPHPRPYLLALGRHVRQKGFDILLHAFAEVIRGGLLSHDLLIAGDGPEKETLERLSYELGLRRYVHFIGATKRPATAALFAGCAFFVLPSRQEPLGIVNLEAMASGKAVLATKVGGVPEIVQDERTGILVPAEDARELAAGIRRMITEPGLQAKLGAAGLERSQCFQWRAVAAQYEQVYQSLRSATFHCTESHIKAHG